MCDTIVATGKATSDGSVILAKNSDREANESQLLKHILKKNHGSDDNLKCTYITIPQAQETNEVLLSKPFWMWGCEMGANEHGLAIGNEAVFTREPYEKEGLLGMDLIRLALERCSSSYDALVLITELIERYGQGGNAGFEQKLYYHNSFILADKKEAWILETANRHWAAVKVEGIRSISNGLTIGEEYHRASTGIEDYARRKGYLKRGETFSFSKAFSDTLYTHFSRCKIRRARTMELGSQRSQSIDTAYMMQILRDHGSDQHYPPPHNTSMGNVCMHASFGPFRPSQSTAAMIAHLRDTVPVYWLTGTSGTCTSMFKPFYVTGKEIDFFPGSETSTFSYQSAWWEHELLHRQAIMKYGFFQEHIAPERDQMEKTFIENERDLISSQVKNKKVNPDKLYHFSRECVQQDSERRNLWTRRLATAPMDKKVPLLFRLFWKHQSKKARIPDVKTAIE
ncbi:MAG: C69 family dipeptidase [Spirochaetota bacterium]